MSSAIISIVFFVLLIVLVICMLQYIPKKSSIKAHEDGQELKIFADNFQNMTNPNLEDDSNYDKVMAVNKDEDKELEKSIRK